jgi:hypothetical protein
MTYRYYGFWAPMDTLVHNRAFNVGATAENYQIRDVARIVAEGVPGSTLEIAAGAAGARDYPVTRERFGDAVGFHSGWTVGSSVDQLLAVYREVGVTLEEFEGVWYQRIGHVQSLMADGVLGPDLRFVGACGPAAG